MSASDEHVSSRLRAYAVMMLTFIAGLVAMSIGAGALAYSRPGGLLGGGALPGSAAAAAGSAAAAAGGTAATPNAADAAANAASQAASSAGQASTSPGGVDQVLLLVLAGMSVVLVAMFLALGPILTSAARRRWRSSTGPAPRDAPGVRAALIGDFGAMSITRAAVGEGLGVFACVVAALTGNMLALIGVGFALIMIIVVLPGVDRFDAFVRDVTREEPFGGSR
ncbi:MAG: hypothetical protein ACK5XO_07015 [Phycisphaerales bacterium]